MICLIAMAYEPAHPIIKQFRDCAEIAVFKANSPHLAYRNVVYLLDDFYQAMQKTANTTQHDYNLLTILAARIISKL